MALADINGDGDVDLFVGGRVLPGKYAKAATSLLLRNDHGKFTVAQKFENLGLVSGAVFSDLDGDGKPELILACEWGPIRIFKSERGKFVPWEAPVTINHQRSTLSQISGWWNGVTTGDLDGDGRLDIIATNWGLNSKYRTSRDHPRKMYYGELEGNGRVEAIETYYDEVMQAEVPERGLRAVAAALPFVKEKYPSFEAYGKSSLHDIYGDKLTRMR